MKSSGSARTHSIDILPASLTIGSLLSRPSQGDRMWLLRQRGGLKLSLGRNKRLIYGRLLLGSRRWRVWALFFILLENRITIKKSPWDLWMQFTFEEKLHLDEHVERYCCLIFQRMQTEVSPVLQMSHRSGWEQPLRQVLQTLRVWSVGHIFSCGEHQSAVCSMKKVHCRLPKCFNSDSLKMGFL